jgi:organic hydroperoxide reductase OsmC/OhrA
MKFGHLGCHSSRTSHVLRRAGLALKKWQLAET